MRRTLTAIVLSSLFAMPALAVESTSQQTTKVQKVSRRSARKAVSADSKTSDKTGDTQMKTGDATSTDSSGKVEKKRRGRKPVNRTTKSDAAKSDASKSDSAPKSDTAAEKPVK